MENNEGKINQNTEQMTYVQRSLRNAYVDINNKINEFYNNCCELLDSSETSRLEQQTRLRNKDEEIEKLKQKKSAKDILESIAIPLATLYNNIYSLSPSETKEKLLKCIEGVNLGFENAGINVIYQAPGSIRNKSKNYSISQTRETNNRELDGRILFDSVGFEIDNEPSVQADITELIFKETYPFQQDVDFHLFKYTEDSIDLGLLIDSRKMIRIIEDLYRKEIKGYFIIDQSYQIGASHTDKLKFYIDNSGILYVQTRTQSNGTKKYALAALRRFL